MSLVLPTLVQIAPSSTTSTQQSPPPSSSNSPTRRSGRTSHYPWQGPVFSECQPDQLPSPPTSQPSRTMEDFAEEIDRLFGAPMHLENMLQMSAQLQMEYKDKLRDSSISMLPSFQHTLPTGRESGDYLALDVGGSTFRLALIQLRGNSMPDTAATSNGTIHRRQSDSDRFGNAAAANKVKARRIKSFVIDERIRSLRGRAFFDWMAERIEEMLLESSDLHSASDPSTPLKTGLAWSFPVEQTSPQTGKLLAMGKGFLADSGLESVDLANLVVNACAARNLHVQMWAIVNDGAATLLSKAYHDPSSTRMSLILGTGMNAALYLPVAALGPHKLGLRPPEWHAIARRVVVNTELSMFGKLVLPTTRWDEDLNAKHIRRDFQPLEYLVTGRYLGEIVRLVLLEAIATAGLFGGRVPAGLEVSYSFETRLVALFEKEEEDPGAALEAAAEAFLAAHPLPPTAVAAAATVRDDARDDTGAADSAAPSPPSHSPRLGPIDLPKPAVGVSGAANSVQHHANSLSNFQDDFIFVRHLARLVSRRAAAYLAIALHALWAVRTEAEAEFCASEPDQRPAAAAAAAGKVSVDVGDDDPRKVTVACDGSMVEKYPGFRARCQDWLDRLCGMSLADTTTTAATAAAAAAAVDGDGTGVDKVRRMMVTLEMTPESSIFGAAIAASCNAAA